MVIVFSLPEVRKMCTDYTGVRSERQILRRTLTDTFCTRMRKGNSAESPIGRLRRNSSVDDDGEGGANQYRFCSVRR